MSLAACKPKPSLLEEAARIATDFFSAGNVSRLSSIDALELVCASKKSDGTPVYYVFNAKDSRGFIIISADDNAIPIVGYSYESSFMPDNVSDATVKMIANAIKQVAGRAGELRSRAKARVSGKKLIKTAEWSQESPFNNLIPNRRLVGCVGTAMATVMKYHNHPASGTGSLDGTDFNTPYDWKNMRTDNYRYGYSAEEAKAVSTLMAHCAISVKTDFGMSGSSAFEVRVPAALISYFGYAPQVSYKKRSETDRATWDGIIINEIEAGRPVIYSGQDVSVGHAFVCDGYEMRGTVPYFHINWGWGGSANGYFSSDALNPTVSTSAQFQRPDNNYLQHQAGSKHRCLVANPSHLRRASGGYDLRCGKHQCRNKVHGKSRSTEKRVLWQLCRAYCRGSLFC